MEREVSLAVELGIGLIAISAVIGIIWFTVFLGKDLANSVTVETSEIIAEMSVGPLDDVMSVGGKEIPTSAAYSLVKTYSGSIFYFKCHHAGCPMRNMEQNLLVSEPCLLRHMSGRVFIEVSKNDAGNYVVDVYDS